MNAAPHMQPEADASALPIHEQAVPEQVHEVPEQAEAPWFDRHFDTSGDVVAEIGGADVGRDAPHRTIVGGFLVFLAVLWTGIAALAAGEANSIASFGLTDLVRWTAIASGPLAVLGLGWLLFGRSSRNETTRFIRSVQQMRGESEALQGVLANIGAQLAANRVALAEESAQLATLGTDASERLGAVTRDVDAGAQAMARYAEQLDRAAGSARTDMGVLLADLPKAEAQARAMSEALRTTSVDAQAGAGALDAQMAVLTQRAREADDASSGVSERVAAHVAQVEQATASMGAVVDATLARAAGSLEATREAMGEQIGRLAVQIAAQDAAAQTVVATVDASLAGLETRLPAVTADGETRLAALGATLDRVHMLLEGVLQSMSGGDAEIGELTARGEGLRTVLAEIDGTLRGSLPAGLDDIEARTERGRVAAEALLPQVAALGDATDAARARLDAATETAAARLADAETLVARQGETMDGFVAGQNTALDALMGKLHAGMSVAQDQAGALGTAVGEADASAERLVRETGPQLIEALLRVREAAMQATERAREAIATAIPDAAARLGEATGAAMQAAITDKVSGQMTELGALTEQAVEAARGASERLTRQMLSIGETAAAVEAHIHEAKESIREADNEQFSRRVATLIESLNSTAIDVAKILSNEVTDSAWSQYLKGDRGVFTRRAVRLLDAGEAREIVRHYEEEPEFREQVNRYIHDFEALLRRVLAERDGSPLGVTLLSSDMGKLYVALAQAIERIRA